MRLWLASRWNDQLRIRIMDVVKDKWYTAKWMRENKVHPCTDCYMPHLCNSQCMWAYWSTGSRENTRYKWDGTMCDGKPVYNDSTWEIER